MLPGDHVLRAIPLAAGVHRLRLFYEPTGLRGRNPSNAAWYWGTREYHAKADVWPLDPQGELLAMMFIESAEGVANIDEIVTVPGR